MNSTHRKDRLVKYSIDDPIFYTHEYGLDPQANHIYLVGRDDSAGVYEGAEPGVDYMMANNFIKNLNLLAKMNDDPILIHLKTCGGDWVEGMAIYQAIKACPNEIIILNYTHARSMSSLIFLAGDKRVFLPHSTFMFHDGTMGYQGTVKQYLTEAEELKKSREIMLNIYIENMQKKGRFAGEPASKIKKWLVSQMDRKEDVYLNAEEAIELGFGDEIFGEDGTYDWKNLMVVSDD